MRPRILALLAILVVTTACSTASLATASEEPTGCAAEQLEITEENQPWEGPSSWTAICKTAGAEPREWFCSKASLDAQLVICSDVPR